MSRFVVCQFGPTSSDGYDWCAHVEADSAREAAIDGATVIIANDDQTDMPDLYSVWVAEVGGPAAYYVLQPTFTAEVAELQCCGGRIHTDDGHSGTCKLPKPRA